MTREQMFETTAAADGIIQACMSENGLKSFFLYAGAGSGKTGSLISALKWAQEARRKQLWLLGRRIGVITYTNAATDEIKGRLAYDPFIEVSTIHSFAWSLIEGFNQDIRQWLRQALKKDIDELAAAQAKGRAGTKTATAREHAIVSKSKRLEQLSAVRTFVYNPAVESKGKGALNHAEVIGMTADLLEHKTVLQRILVDRFPILFVDESQDTNRALMDALLTVQAAHRANFCLGLFGDTMQRIYLDGKVDLSSSIPADWQRPAKLVNYRCATRVLRLINLIRKQEDGQEQAAPDGTGEGYVRLFVASSESADRAMIEDAVSARMAEVTSNGEWGSTKKTLILEHHMAATRMGFAELFRPLYAVDAYRTGLINGMLPHLDVLTNIVAPLIEALSLDDRFAVARIVGKASPLVDASTLKSSIDQIVQLRKANTAAKSLQAVCQDNNVTVGAVLSEIHRSGLFVLPDIIKDVLDLTGIEPEREAGQASSLGEELEAWRSVLDVPFAQVARYAAYTKVGAPFGTHQGVKGLEFANVMVIIDDHDARGFLFSYEKLFGLKTKTDSDRKNEAEGLETTIDRTRRLLYVTCSRAKESLAVVAYCSDPARLRKYVIDLGWFDANEVEEVR